MVLDSRCGFPKSAPVNSTTALFIGFLQGIIVCAFSGAARGELAPPMQQALDRVIEAKVKANLVPGIAVVVMDGENVAYTFARGAAGGEPITPETPFLIGSISKLFTATSVLQLVDRGMIELDAPVTRYLPEFRLADAQAAGQITVRQLLNQNSGLPTDAPRASGPGRKLLDHVAALSGAQLAEKPGGSHVYSSPNYQVLGALVERVSGESFAQYLQTNIFVPLGLRHSYTEVSEAQANSLVPGRNLWFGLAGPSIYRFEPDRLPTASVMTSAGDLGRFLTAHLQDGRVGEVRIFSESAARLMHEGAAEAGNFKYAMGLRAGTTAGVPSLWHGGALPNYRAAVVLLPNEQRAVVVLTNVSTLFNDHTREIAAAIVATLAERPLPPAPRALWITYLGVVAGSLVLLLVQGRSLMRASRGEKKAAVIPALVDVGVPIALLLILPRWFGASLRGMFEAAPDIMLVAALLALLSLSTGLVKLIRRRGV